VSKEKKPIFISGIPAITDSIKRIIDFKEMTFYGNQHEATRLLTWEIIDPPLSIRDNCTPEEDDTLEEIGKRITKIIKKNLKDSEEYNTYTIKFTHKDHNWRNSSITRYYWYQSNSIGINKMRY
jgi:hypothetical protein